MKFAICNETFVDWPLDRALTFAAEHGYTGIEFAPFTLASDIRTLSAHQRADIRRLAESSGLEVVGLHWLLAKTEGLHLTSPDADARRRTADYLADLARLCRDLGGKLLVLGSPQQRNLPAGVTLHEGHDYAHEILTACLPALEQTGTTLAVEPLRHEDTNFLSSTAEAVELIRRTGSAHCRLQLDCRAMSSEATPIPDLIQRYHEMLVHFHVNDANGQGPGFGQMDFRPILDALGRIHYRGWVSVEVFEYAPGVERLASESIEYLRECLEAVSDRHPTLGVQQLEDRIE